MLQNFKIRSKFEFILLILLASYSLGFAQSGKEPLMNSLLKRHIYVLAADSLDGRRTGTAGEQKAIQYILSQYELMGFNNTNKNVTKQKFEFNYGYEYTGANEIRINDIAFKRDVDFFPLPGSASANIDLKDVRYAGYGIQAADLNYNDYSTLKDSLAYIISLGSPEGENPHSKYYPYTDVSYKIKTAIQHGAKGIIIINTDSSRYDNIKKDFTKNAADKNIPIVFLKYSAASKLNLSGQKPFSAQLTIAIRPVKREGTNVLAYLNNNSQNTVIIGAHYDHLGHGEDGNSLSGGAHEIHNGADDNASGTAAVIELARILMTSKSKHNNYLFIHFSGEELGLIGSKYFVEHAPIDTASINYMINMDMIGRYQQDKGLEISGLGTSPRAFDFIKKIEYDSLKIKLSEHGVGPTDHTSFYYANIPVLNFFTGTHEDYHKPGDDAHKINYDKQVSIIYLITQIIDSLNNKGVLTFSKTKELNTTDMPAFKVKLGVIPDYMFEGNGLRIDGVNSGQPASNAGMQKGDVIIQIGDYPVTDIMSYMKTLSMFSKGSKTTIRFIRNNQETIADLQF